MQEDFAFQAEYNRKKWLSLQCSLFLKHSSLNFQSSLWETLYSLAFIQLYLLWWENSPEVNELFLGTLELTQTTSKYGAFREWLFMDFSKNTGSLILEK